MSNLAELLSLVAVVFTAVAIGGAIRLTGALLVDGLTLLPALGARNLGHSLRSMVILLQPAHSSACCGQRSSGRHSSTSPGRR